MKTLIVTAMTALSLISASAEACSGGIIEVGPSTMLTEDRMTSTVRSEGIVMSRTTVSVNPGFEASLDSAYEGASNFRVKLLSQKRDEGGVMSSTYEIREVNDTTYPALDKTEIVRITSNYHGNGVRARGGCGSVTRTPKPTR